MVDVGAATGISGGAGGSATGTPGSAAAAAAAEASFDPAVGGTTFDPAGFNADQPGVDSFGNALGGNQGAGSIGVPSSAGLAGFFGALTGIPFAGQALSALANQAGNVNFGVATPGFGPNAGPGGEIPESLARAIQQARTLSPEFSNLTASPGFSTAVTPNANALTSGGTNFANPSNFSQFSANNFGFSAPGGTFAVTPGGGAFTPSTSLTEAQRARSQRFGTAASFLDTQAAQFDLGPLVAAQKQGFAETRTRLGNAEARTVSDVTDQFARRRLSGSSFAIQGIAAARAEFAAQRRSVDTEERIAVAQARLTEIEQKTNIQNQANQLRIQQTQADITDIFGQTEQAATLASQFAELFTNNLNAQLQASVTEGDSIRRTLASLEAARIGAEAGLEQTRLQGETDIRVAQLGGQSRERIAGQQRESDAFGGIGSLIGTVLGAPGGGVADKFISSVGKAFS